jgi:AcrR family transcriptional regulator
MNSNGKLHTVRAEASATVENVTTAPPRRWYRRKRERPGEILDAALVIVQKNGYSAARMQDIAAQAGITKGTIYLYFAGKKDLFKALIDQRIGHLAITEEKTCREDVAKYDGAVLDE